MFGFGKTPESSSFNPELIKLPQPSEYVGSYFEKKEGKTDLGRAVELLQIHDEMEKGQ